MVDFNSHNNPNKDRNPTPNAYRTSMLLSKNTSAIGSTKKTRTQVLRRDSNNATPMIFASFPSTSNIDPAIRTTSSTRAFHETHQNTTANNNNTKETIASTGLLLPDSTTNDNDYCTTRNTVSQIRHFKCTTQHHQFRNFYDPIDETFPLIESLNFSHNQISTTDTVLKGLDRLLYLQHLDLSYNHISSLPTIHYQLGRIVTLNVSHNRIQVVDGIDRLYSLQVLHLNHNRISDLHRTASQLANLPLLQQLYIADNPCCVDEQLSSFQNQDPTATDVVVENQTNNRVPKKRPLYYHVNIWNAFIERRLSTMYPTPDQRKQLTIRDVQNELIPQIDGKYPNPRQWYILQNRIFTIVERRTAIPAIVKPYTTEQINMETTLTQTIHSNSRRWNIGNSSDTSQPNAVMRRRHRKKSRVIVSIDDNTDITTSPTGKYCMCNDDQKHRIIGPTPAFSIVDVVDSLRVSFHVVTNPPSSIPPCITCRHDSAVGSPELITTASDTDDLVGLDDNIGQIYLDFIESSRRNEENKAISTSDDAVRNDYATETSQKHNSTNSTSCGRTSAEASFKVISKAENDTNETVLTEENDGDCREVVSLEQISEVMDNVSLSRDSVNGNITPSKQSIEKSTIGNEKRNMERIVNGSISTALPSGSPESPQHKLTVLVNSFSENQWYDDNISLPSGINYNNVSPNGKSTSSDRISRHEMFRLAEMNSKYIGPKTYQNLLVHENLELYCRLFVFSPALALMPKIEADNEQEGWRVILQRYPRIQLWPVDRTKRDEVYTTREIELGKFDVLHSTVVDQHEVFHRVWKEKVVGCGKPALRRLTPSRAARYGFHGELLWSAAGSSQIKPEAVVECREAICCLSNIMFYIIVDHDTVTRKPQKDPKREFPLPIPDSATFKNAKWPHALVCHSLDKLRRITIGFGFQRLTLHFEEAVSPNNLYVYVLLTCNKLETIALLKIFQDLSSAQADLLIGLTPKQNPGIQIENDDPLVLDSLAAAVSPDIVGAVLHYQILQQKWKSGGRGKARRVCVVTDSKVYLLDEDYFGDGADIIDVVNQNSLRSTHQNELGNCRHCLVDVADLDQIESVASDDSDPNSVTIVMKPIARLTRRRNWRLVCRDNLQGAEQLVDDLRKAVSLL
jgi:hypothetical protein